MNLHKMLIVTPSFLGLLSTDPKACTRTDLEDLTPHNVVEESLERAKMNDYSHVTGVILVRTENDILRGPGAFTRYGTGIALDPKTVLTAAHYISDTDEKMPLQLRFALHPNPMNSGVEYITVSTVVLHPTFHRNPLITKDPVSFKQRGNSIYPYLGDISLEELTYPQVDQSPLNAYRGFLGVDLAILKLESPLSNNLIFPEILPQNHEIIDTYGFCLGYGRMYYNYQDKGPTRVIDDQQKSIVRHLINSKVNAYTSINKGPVLYGNYKGSIIHGEYSFLPNSNMLKTEGMPVGGDSGGPLFIEHEGKYKLAGINSYKWSALGNFKVDPNVAETYNKFTQPIFPVWVDIRTHIKDIYDLTQYTGSFL